MKRKKSLSIVIPHFNSNGLIKRALQSVDNLSRENISDLEVIIIDDGSSEDQLDILLRSVDEFSTHMDIKIEKLLENKGIPSARNAGVKTCSKEFVLFLDQDDMLQPSIIDSYVSILNSFGDKTIGAIYCKVKFVDSRGVLLGISGPPFPKKFYGEFFIIDKNNAYLIFNFPIPSASGILIPRIMFDEFGLLDTSLYSGDEIEFLSRVVVRYPIIYLNEVGVEKLVHTRNASRNTIKMVSSIYLLLDKVSLNLGYSNLSVQYNRASLLHSLKVVILFLENVRFMSINLKHIGSAYYRLWLTMLNILLRVILKVLRVIVRNLMFK